jgi:hypothetical protein
MEHLIQNARRGGPGGSAAYACLHRPGHEPESNGAGRRSVVAAQRGAPKPDSLSWSAAGQLALRALC